MDSRQLRSNIPKHRGAVFFKREPTRDDFVLKLYREYGYLADLVTDFLDQLVQCDLCKRWLRPVGEDPAGVAIGLEAAVCLECRGIEADANTEPL